MIALVSTGGCGCWKDPLGKAGKKPETLEEMEQRRKELEAKKQEKPDFEPGRLAVLPADDSPARNLVKPGHWFNAIRTTKANNFDFTRGDLDAQCVDRSGRPVALPGTNFDMSTSRPVSLPKGQQKHFDVLLFASKPPQGPIWFQTRLRARGGGREVDPARTEPTTTMKPYQNYLVVLAEYSDNYQFVKTLRSVKPVRSNDDFDEGNDLDYFVKLPKGTRRIDLPTHPLTWTNIAYVIWDDFNPSILSLSQQQAMIDWLHWGGQLIISGPRTLDLLAGSEFGEYLPARPGETSSLSDDTIKALNDAWSFPEAGQLKLGTSKRPLTIQLELTDRANFVENTVNLVAEKPIGRGRVVVTGFSIPHEALLAWDSFDSFFNACLLGRPPRRFETRLDGPIVDVWDDRGLSRDDPRLTSQVRYFSRDAMSSTTKSRSDQRGVDLSSVQSNLARPQPTASTSQAVEFDHPGRLTTYRSKMWAENDADWAINEQSEVDGLKSSRLATTSAGLIGFAHDNLMGVAGWNDTSDVSRAARDALGASSGIKVPSAGFIAQVLGIYLLVLVPANWIVFRMMGRVEWAWAAVPVIAIGGALAVVHIAQLDIGFVRSRTEIAVVEMQPDYDRGHLTRYVGLYSSLSSRYEIRGDDDSTLIQPLASSQPVSNRRVALYQGDDVSLTGFSVLSNSTGMVHGEQMIDLGGSIRLSSVGEKLSVTNQTDHDLVDTVIVRRTMQDQVQVAWPGAVPSKQQQLVTFLPLKSLEIVFPEREALPEGAGKRSTEGGLDVQTLIELATDPNRLGLGEAVLVGWNDLVMPGLKIRPSAAQVSVRTVFVAQLSHAARPKPVGDANSYQALLRIKREQSNSGASGDIF